MNPHMQDVIGKARIRHEVAGVATLDRVRQILDKLDGEPIGILDRKA
jgi:hypothetical protein